MGQAGGQGEAGRRGVEAVRAMADQFGPYALRLRDVLALLADRPRTLDSLVRGSGLSRRSVEELLAAAGPDIERQGDEYLLREEAAPDYLAQFSAAPGPSRGAETALDEVPEQVAREIAALVAGAPAAKERLDHVAATPATAARRAVWLAQAYDPARTRLLCVGDHDLTALAACLVSPALAVRVVDIDEDLLAYIDAAARRLSLDIACYYADLRFGLPPELAGWGEVAFTDPPYTPEGVGLFAARGLEGLRAREFGNVVVCYGAGERHPALAWKVQQALSGGLGLAFEAVLPRFSAYHGAQAIGSRSDLYVCRPTSATWKLVEERRRPGGARIYTRGPQSLESAGPSPDPAAQRALLRLATRDGEAPLAGVVADGWTPGQESGPGAVRHARLGTLFSQGLPAEWPRDGAVAIDLSGDPGPWLARGLLAANAARVAALVPNNHRDVASAAGQSALRELLAGKYGLRFHRSVPAPGQAMVEAVRQDGGDGREQLRRFVLERAHGATRTAWREGLIRIAKAGGRDLTKNQARAIIDAADTDPRQPARLIDMPRGQISRLLALLDASADA